MSEAEQFFKDRYSKKNIGLMNLEKIGQRLASGSKTGFLGSKIKPVLVPVAGMGSTSGMGGSFKAGATAGAI